MVDSGASMHMMSKMELSPEEYETVNVSRLSTTVIAVGGSINRRGYSLREKLGHVRHGPQLLEDPPGEVSLGKLCDENEYSYAWI